MTDNIGRALRMARADRGLSLRQLSRLVHFSPGHLSKVENGAKLPSLELAMACDRVLGIRPPITELAARLTGTRTAPPPVPAEPRLIPAQLPHAPSGFVGRCTELSVLRGVAGHGGGRSTPRCCLLTGGPHAGKTALAVHLGHAVAHQFADGQLYLDLRGSDPTEALDPAAALGHLLRGLGAEPGDIPEHPRDRVARYRSLVAGRNILLVLDDAAGSDQVRPLLPGIGPSLVLVTSRNRLPGLVVREGATEVKVDYLSDDLTRQLLSGMVGDHRMAADPTATAELVSLLGGMPLAIRAAAVRLGDATDMTIAQYVSEIRATGPLSALAVDDDHLPCRVSARAPAS